MIALMREELALLHIMCCVSLTKKSIKVTAKGVTLFPQGVLPHLTKIYSQYVCAVAEKQKNENTLQLDKQVFAADALNALEGSTFVKELKDRGRYLLDQYVSAKENQYNEETGSELLGELVEHHFQRKISTELVKGSAFESLRSMVERGSNLLTEVTEVKKDDEPSASDLLAAIPSLMQHRNKISFGLPYLDYATRGGVCTREMAAIGAGTGGGKTMMAVDIVCEQARLGNRTLWFSYEQPFSNDISERIFAHYSGIKLEDIRNKNFEDLPEEQRQAFFAATSGMDNLIGVDFSSDKLLDKDDPRDDGGAYSIEKQIIKANKDNPRKVKFVILDWFGEIISQLAARKGLDLTNGYRYFARDFLRELREVMDRQDVFIILFHQLSQKACDARPTYIPNKTDFQDIRSLANNMEYCFLIGKRDDNDVCYFRTDKARTCSPSTQIIQMDGDHARFHKVEGWFPGKDGNFFNPAKMDKDMAQDKDIQDRRTADILASYSTVL